MLIGAFIAMGVLWDYNATNVFLLHVLSGRWFLNQVTGWIHLVRVSRSTIEFQFIFLTGYWTHFTSFLAVHHYLIRGFSEAALLSDGVWSLYASVAVNVLIAFISQSFFTIRIHKLSPDQQKWWISGPIGFLVFAHLCKLLDKFRAHKNISAQYYGPNTGFGMVCRIAETIAYFFIKKEFIRLKDITLIAATPFGITAILSDIVIALALCILLHNNKSEFEDTNHIINKLIVYAINRCLLTSIMAVIEVVLFGVTPNPFYTFGIDFVIGKLYANSLLAALNARGSIRTTVVECNSTELSTNFVATGIDTEHEHSILHVRSRENARDHRVQSVGVELEAGASYSGGVDNAKIWTIVVLNYFYSTEDWDSLVSG
ncbi:hypothetical protein NP233_g2302 [Leucocoprinus birnbaumii]|uniref:DUF6534 domain-containing protein n=1 Tax=Leucocoprinus birnbaumii TaxID=56174 RepID=A0AAD5VYM3_9AGAR|nr:hypothetical protein NP233_g2302 [Leucocoprinus birnbaumii]